MESYIRISLINDFIFCPLSIYYHELCSKRSVRSYHREAQTAGNIAHQSIDKQQYTTAKSVIEGLEVYSEKYGICGKIDILDTGKHTLIERKKHITRIYDGYIFQLYAQYFALIEMGYKVLKLQFYSYDDNKVYLQKLPNDDKIMFRKFEETLCKMINFDISDFIQTNREKCLQCVYEPLCGSSLC